jgi:hypothetical protein
MMTHACSKMTVGATSSPGDTKTQEQAARQAEIECRWYVALAFVQGHYWATSSIKLSASVANDVRRTVCSSDVGRQRDVPALHTGLISCSTGTSIPPKVEIRARPPWLEAGIEPTTFQAPPYVCYGKARALPTELPPPVRTRGRIEDVGRRLSTVLFVWGAPKCGSPKTGKV